MAESPDSPSHVKLTELASARGIYGTSFEVELALFSAQRACASLHGAKVLELGCGFGYSTQEIARQIPDLTVVDASEHFLEATRLMMPAGSKPTFVKSGWLEFSPAEKYTDVILFRGLEYFPEALPLLQKIDTLLEPGGALHLLITNRESLHNQVGAMAGMSQSGKLTQREQEVGKVCSYSAGQMEQLLRSSGLRIIHQEGIGLKPLPNSEMSRLDPSLQGAFARMGDVLPHMAAETYFIVQWR